MYVKMVFELLLRYQSGEPQTELLSIKQPNLLYNTIIFCFLQ